MAPKYAFKQLSDDSFEVYQSGHFLLAFRRSTLRHDFDRFRKDSTKTSQAVGTILRLFHQKFPFPIREHSSRTPHVTEERLVEYYRSKGFRVTKPIALSDKDGIKVLEHLGWELEGLLNDMYYSTSEKKVLHE